LKEEDHIVVQEGKGFHSILQRKRSILPPVQEVNRDLSIAVIKLFQEDEESDIVSNKDFTILEALSATGNVPNLLKSDKKKACVLSTMRRK
jgi:tRNA G26 N,N-dimethylase Trm1